MNKFEALQLLGLSGTVSSADIKIAYKRKAKEYHPDRNPQGAKIMQMINAAYELVKDLDGVEVYENEKMANYPEALAAALHAIAGLNLTIEICGSWVWVSGNTKPHKETLKTAGYKWSKNKSMWYFRPATFKSRKGCSSDEWSIDKIRETFGSERPHAPTPAYLPTA